VHVAPEPRVCLGCRGNLLQREERNRGVYEQLAYDNRDRLDYAQRAGSVTLDLSYDETGTSPTSPMSHVSLRHGPQACGVAAGANNTPTMQRAVVNASGT